MNRTYIRIKYAADFLVALIAVIVFSPLMAGVAIAIKAEDGGSVIFSQRRTGAGGKKFNCYKFRSMKSTDVHFDKTSPIPSKKTHARPFRRDTMHHITEKGATRCC